MKLKTLIERLANDKTRYHDQEVEFIVVRKTDGVIITMEMEGQASNVVHALELFKGHASDG